MTSSPSLSPVEQHALKVAQAAEMSRSSAYGIADTIVIALGGAQLLQSPQTAVEDAARHHREGVDLAVATLRLRAREVHTPADLAALLDEVSTAPLTVYRAECDTIPLDTYQSRQAARDHCRAQMERAEPDRIGLHWVPVEEDEPDGMEVLAYVDADGERVETDFVVTPIAVQAAYDPEACE